MVVLVDLHRVGARAERKVTQELVSEFRPGSSACQPVIESWR